MQLYFARKVKDFLLIFFLICLVGFVGLIF